MENHQKGIIIPHDRLSQEALHGLIEEFVTGMAPIPVTLMAAWRKALKWSLGSCSAGKFLLSMMRLPGPPILYQRKMPELFLKRKGRAREAHMCILDGDLALIKPHLPRV